MGVDLQAAGRVCPLDYQLSPGAFASLDAPRADVLYLAGGLYGNPFALDTIESLVAQDSATGAQTRLALNGDFHWFDASENWFAQIHERTSHHLLTRGNVETELSRGGDTDAGCGCAYPASVANEDVERSNRIMRDLGLTARAAVDANTLRAIGNLPPIARVQVGPASVGITHGDDSSLAGWSFAEDQLTASWRGGLTDRMLSENLDIFASSHTCLPVADTVLAGKRDLAVINNGSAGMANFTGTTFGVVSRIAHLDAPPPPIEPLYQALVGGVTISALPVHFDMTGWLALFESVWPVGSAASDSYLPRIMNGPAYPVERAMRGTFGVSQSPTHWERAA